MLLSRTTVSASDRCAADWAAHEARLRGVPLRALSGPLPATVRATAIVCGVRRTDAVPPPPLFGAQVTAVSAPMVLVPEDLGPSQHRSGLVLGVDARDPARAAIGFAFDCARVRGGRLHAVHAWELPPDTARLPFGVPDADRATWEDQEVQLLADVLRPWRARYPGVPVLEDVRLLAPAEALLRCSAKAALIVIGRSPRAIGWGSVARALLPEAVCPLAVVPSS
ncbi:universal stress protein [Streptomyces sp. NPDC091217]|uniref:universal stress protein n=1 Tax=Streptomyces sp. NPDC091217 TaxID=3365975 RepID=UPI00380C441D